MTTQNPAQDVSDAELVRIAKAFCRRHSDDCNVNYDDAWKLYSDAFMADAKFAVETVRGGK